MKLVKLVLALIFGGQFIAACEGGHHRSANLPGQEVGDFSVNKQLYGDDDDEGW